MNKYLYPDDWNRVAFAIKEACGWCCVACDKQCRRPGEFYLGYEYELTVAHICQDYEAESIYVAALCLPCHLAHDAPLSWVARLRRQRFRRHMAGQLTLNVP